jgi:hypothetical protein
MMRLFTGTVKFPARQSQDRAGTVDMVILLEGADGRPNGQEIKVYAPLDANHLASYKAKDHVPVIGYMGADNVVYYEVPGDLRRSPYRPYTAEELSGAGELAEQNLNILMCMFAQAAGHKGEGPAPVSEETARTLATTAFIQTFRSRL